ncbi:MAG: phytanoyl-CoA dioxygenase family protein [Rubripirellula sp.]
MITLQQQRQLDQQGYVVLPDVIAEDAVDALNDRITAIFEIEGDQAGAEFKREPGCLRLANLVNKGEVFQSVIANANVLSCVGAVLADYKLSSLNARVVPAHCPGDAIVRQPLHADMAAVPDDQGYWVCNALWMLQDITEENGPLRVVPGTHKRGRLPQQAMKDPTAIHPDQVLVTGRAGSVVVINAHLWHGGMENHARQPRRALHAFYCRRDKPQQQYQKRLLDADVQNRLDPELRELLALDDEHNDRVSAHVDTTSGFIK